MRTQMAYDERVLKDYRDNFDGKDHNEVRRGRYLKWTIDPDRRMNGCVATCICSWSMPEKQVSA